MHVWKIIFTIAKNPFLLMYYVAECLTAFCVVINMFCNIELYRYEVPYSEHCSFEELKEFVKLISAVEIIPSVNNEGAESRNDMLALLLS